MNNFGRIFQLQIFGESHGKGVGVVIDGCPAGVDLSEQDFYHDLNRRRAGAKGTTTRKELDKPNLLSGYFEGYTTGAPLTVWFENNNVRSNDYSNLLSTPRPSHADFVATHKYKGYSDFRGGGHFSGRLTLGLVAAGVVAKKILKNVEIDAYLKEVGGYKNIAEVPFDKAKDSFGGLVECKVEGVPIGWGEPFFDSIESHIAHLAFAIPGVKGIEFGSGFQSAKMKGSQHNDMFIDGKGTTLTNNAGGINGGITNGNPIIFRLAIKPTSSISKIQQTYNFDKKRIDDLKIKGRHDACIALRVPVIVEAITAIALADFKLLSQ